MNRPGTFSFPSSLSSLIINHRSTTPTTTKSGSCSWYWRPFQRSIYNICPPSKKYRTRLSRTGPPEPPHDTKFGPTAHPNQFCPAAYTRFPLRWTESPAATTTITAISHSVTPPTPPATSLKRTSKSIPSTEHDTEYRWWEYRWWRRHCTIRIFYQ